MPVIVIGGLKDDEPVPVRLARLCVGFAVTEGEPEADTDPEPVLDAVPDGVPEGLKEMVVEPVPL